LSELLPQAHAALADMRWREAADLFGQALAQAPNMPALMVNRAIALVELNEMAEALALFRRAFALAPTDSMVVANYANFLSYLGADELAVAASAAALSLTTGPSEIAVNHSMILLRAGRLKEGWTAFEKRRRQIDPAEKAGIPLLPDLDAARDRRVLLFHEQGLGDSLQFLRYVPLLAKAGAIVTLRMPPELTRLASTVEGAAQVIAEDAPTPPGIAFVLPMMSLARIFGTELATIPQNQPYLRPDPAECARWRDELAGLPAPRIGLVWAGSPRGGLDHRRSMSFANLLPIFGRAGTFVCLQKGVAGQDWAPPVGTCAFDPTNRLPDFATTVALLTALDLVITVDTSMVHAAGSVDVPVWMLNRFDTCWRWLSARTDSPWYPKLRQFRQPRPGDWQTPIAQVSQALRAIQASGEV
jgi:hypothetical protein